MIIKEKAIEVVSNSIPLLSLEDRFSIKELKKSLIDSESSFLSELSSYNNFLAEMIEFNKELILNEYIEYLIKEIEKSHNKTMDVNSANKISRTAYNLKDMSNNFEDNEFKERIKLLEDKLSTLIKYDILKSTKIKPVADSKVSDFIDSLAIRLNEISEDYSFIYRGILECENLIECCDFCSYLYTSKIATSDGYIALLEEPYNLIVRELINEYYNWKGEGKCPYLLK